MVEGFAGIFADWPTVAFESEYAHKLLIRKNALPAQEWPGSKLAVTSIPDFVGLDDRGQVPGGLHVLLD